MEDLEDDDEEDEEEEEEEDGWGVTSDGPSSSQDIPQLRKVNPPLPKAL